MYDGRRSFIDTSDDADDDDDVAGSTISVVGEIVDGGYAETDDAYDGDETNGGFCGDEGATIVQFSSA